MNRIDITKEAKIENLSTLQKVGQVVMPRLDFYHADTLTLAMSLVRDFHVGGFIVFGGTKSSVLEATEQLQLISEIPLIFACDAERGVGQILSDMTLFPFTMSLGAVGDERLVYDQAAYIAKEMKECGFNLIFAPILDVNTNPQNPIINIRAYGEDPEFVSRMGRAFITGCQESGLPACGKHFPGHGSVNMDSHEELPVINSSLEDLSNCELIPFKDAVDSGVASLMTAHLSLPGVAEDALPATISPRVIEGILRNTLGFKGVVFTDSFHMTGINSAGDEGDLSHMALKAGCDVVLDPKNPRGLLSKLNDMALSGELGENTLSTAAGRVLSFKERWLSDPTPAASVSAGNAEKLTNRIAQGSICLLKGGKLTSRKANVYVFDVTDSKSDISKEFTNRLRKASIEVESVPVSLRTPADSLVEKPDVGEAAICLIYTTVGAWKKQFTLPGLYKTSLRELSELSAETILVSFGSPYVVRGFDKFNTVICAFDSLHSCQSAAADVILGNLPASGRLPVHL